MRAEDPKPMNSRPKRPFSPTVLAVIDDFLPIIKKWDTGKYAISIGGSQGKGTWDSHSDIDFRLFHEKNLPWTDVNPEMWVDYFAALERWKGKGVFVDGVWTRRIDVIDKALDRWLDGEIKPDDIFWTVWGYHLLPDIYHQAEIEDPYGVIAGWKQRLAPYPPKLKKAVLEKHLYSLRYWRNDYHYANKVKRSDVVFLAGLSARLVHDIMQVLFALNETYFVGDGQNLDFAEQFTIKPEHLSTRIHAILYPRPCENMFTRQRQALCDMIDEIDRLAAGW